MRKVVALVVSITALAGAVEAQAATPFTAGSGYGHDLAVGSDGTGHVVWLTDEEPEDRLGYCRVPAGASACDGESGFLDFPGTSAFSLNDDAQVFAPAPNVVVVLGSCFSCPSGAQDHVYRWISTNNGVDFSGPTDEGDIALGGQAGYIDAASDVILGTEGALFQAMDDPAPSPDTAELNLGGGSFVYSPAVVYDPVTDKLVHAINDLNTVKYAYLTDATPTAAELNTAPTAPLAANEWHTDNFLSSPEGDNDETHLSAGPNGIFLTYRVFVPGNSRVGLRRFDPVTNTFGGPVYADGENTVDDNSLDHPHHSQDASGRLHFVWRNLYDGNRLRYSRSDDGGATFSTPGNLALREDFIEPFVEAGPTGSGFAVWKGIGSSPIRVVVIDPQPEPSPPGGPGGGGDVPGSPSVTDLGIGDSTLTPGQGTTFTFNTSEGGRAVLTFRKRVKGLKIRQRGRRRCVPQTRRRLRQLRRRSGSPAAFRRALRRRRCKAWKKVGEIRQDVTTGRNEIVWNGRVAGRRLSPGLYRAELKITDVAGNVSRTERLRFRVRRR